MIVTPGMPSESNITASDVADCTARESSGADAPDADETDDAGAGSAGSQPDL